YGGGIPVGQQKESGKYITNIVKGRLKHPHHIKNNELILLNAAAVSLSVMATITAFLGAE
ncbi:1459_t:CDS:2, partial [Gigaspora margarita]